MAPVLIMLAACAGAVACATGPGAPKQATSVVWVFDALVGAQVAVVELRSAFDGDAHKNFNRVLEEQLARNLAATPTVADREDEDPDFIPQRGSYFVYRAA